MKEILDGILEAIEDEINAQKHYQRLAQKAKDPKMKSFFEQLRMDEEEHEKILRSRYKSFEKMFNTDKNAFKEVIEKEKTTNINETTFK